MTSQAQWFPNTPSGKLKHLSWYIKKSPYLLWSDNNPGIVHEGANEIDRLERENAALREENRKAHDMACEDAVERYRLNGENAALRQDKERLDWLGEKCCGASNSERYLPFRVYWKQTTIRAAIDAARAKEAKS